MASVGIANSSSKPENSLFEYTSGRWIFNEHTRLEERKKTFDIEALKLIIASSVRQSVSQLTSLTKLAEGGYNRILEATFHNGVTVLARLPYPVLAPKHYAVASEAATLRFLRTLGVPVPKVLGYSATAENEIGTEYLLLEKLHGVCLGNIWYIIDNKQRKRINQQVINMEQKLLRTYMPASGSIYYLQDLGPSDRHIPMKGTAPTPGDLVIGPTAQFEWHYKERTSLREHMGPWTSFFDCFEAPARRELAWCERYGRPRYHVERYLHALHNFEKISYKDYEVSLKDYLTLAPSLTLPGNHAFARPVLRHPDLSPNNIIVSDDMDIIGFIDWQHAAVLPLCLTAGIPKHFQNWGDPFSEQLKKPETQMPEGYNEMSSGEKSETLELMRRRLVHFLYAAKTMVQIPEHFEAIRQPAASLRCRLYTHATWPWEGNNLTLQKDLIDAVKAWPLMIKPGVAAAEGVYSHSTDPVCPLKYDAQQIEKCEAQVEREEEKAKEYHEMRDALDVDQQGWVPDDDHFEKSKAMATIIKSSLLEEATNETERKAVVDRFPFDDHDEDD